MLNWLSTLSAVAVISSGASTSWVLTTNNTTIKNNNNILSKNNFTTDDKGVDSFSYTANPGQLATDYTMVFNVGLLTIEDMVKQNIHSSEAALNYFLKSPNFSKFSDFCNTWHRRQDLSTIMKDGFIKAFGDGSSYLQKYRHGYSLGVFYTEWNFIPSDDVCEPLWIKPQATTPDQQKVNDIEDALTRRDIVLPPDQDPTTSDAATRDSIKNNLWTFNILNLEKLTSITWDDFVKIVNVPNNIKLSTQNPNNITITLKLNDATAVIPIIVELT